MELCCTFGAGVFSKSLMDILQCTEVRFITAIEVVNPRERKLVKRTSVQWAEIISGGTFLFLCTCLFTIVAKNTSSAGSNPGGCVDLTEIMIHTVILEYFNIKE